MKTKCFNNFNQKIKKEKKNFPKKYMGHTSNTFGIKQLELYKERLENAYFIASLELKRFLDRKILSKLKKALKEVSDDRFNELYLDVRFYDAKKEKKYWYLFYRLL